MREVLLGSETDDALFERLCTAVRSLGGSMSDSEWVLGGSQEITTYMIVLPAGTLEAVAETYIGLSLRGPDELVNSLSSRVLS
jgi:hypothetical protein